MQYDPISDFFTWNTGEKENLSPHFYTFEFQAKDPLVAIHKIRGDLIHKLELVHQELELASPVGHAVQVNRGYATAADQERLKALGYEVATGVSQHELGAAADIANGNIPLLLSICEKHFKAIGVGKYFLHVDLRDDKILRRWEYKSRTI